MAWQPAHLTTAQLEERRREGAKLLRRAGYSQAEVARELGVSEKAVSNWAEHLRQGGVRQLRARHRTGRPSKLTDAQWREVKALIRRNPKAFGFETERWTLRRVAEVIRTRFGVEFNANYLAERLHRLGLSPQVPKRRASERDDELIEAWLKGDWPRIKRGLRALGQP